MLKNNPEYTSDFFLDSHVHNIKFASMSFFQVKNLKVSSLTPPIIGNFFSYAQNLLRSSTNSCWRCMLAFPSRARTGPKQFIDIFSAIHRYFSWFLSTKETMDQLTLENLQVDSLVSPLFLKDVHVNRNNLIKNG